MGIPRRAGLDVSLAILVALVLLPIYASMPAPTVEYPSHPLFGRRLRVREGARRGRFDIVLVEDRPGQLRELPRWMCDPPACARIDLGPSRVALDALLKLASALQDISGFR